MNAIRSSILSAVLVGVASASGAGEIDVMTQNQYIGADLALGAPTSDPDAAVVSMLSNIAAQRPAERVRALAAMIKQRNPDVVGLQEAFKFTCTQDLDVPKDKGCNDPVIKDAITDHLQGTEEALRGKYVVAGMVTNLKIDAIPFKIGGYHAVLSLVDRDAILVRADLSAESDFVDFEKLGLCSTQNTSDQGCNYQIALDLPLPPPLPSTLKRGFLAVAVTVKGQHYCVFNTHLEQRLLASSSYPHPVQVGQAFELLGAALATQLNCNGVKPVTVIVVGDINSDPRDRQLAPQPLPYPTPYEIFTLSGHNTLFWDTWTLRPRTDSGLSCCQKAELQNRRSELYERIDMIFSLTRPSHVLDMKLLGNTMGNKTSPPGNGGLWPSDHAALAAKLKFN